MYLNSCRLLAVIWFHFAHLLSQWIGSLAADYFKNNSTSTSNAQMFHTVNWELNYGKRNTYWNRKWKYILKWKINHLNLFHCLPIYSEINIQFICHLKYLQHLQNVVTVYFFVFFFKNETQPFNIDRSSDVFFIILIRRRALYTLNSISVLCERPNTYICHTFCKVVGFFSWYIQRKTYGALITWECYYQYGFNFFFFRK